MNGWVFNLSSFPLCYVFENDHSEMLEKVNLFTFKVITDHTYQ